MSKYNNLRLMCLLLTLGLAVSIGGCSGWSIMGYDLEGSNDSVFHEVTQDSVTHYYRDIRVGENWCFFHQQYENVELVSE